MEGNLRKGDWALPAVWIAAAIELVQTKAGDHRQLVAGRISGRDRPRHLVVAADRGFGAGEGNRTLVCSLGSCRSAIELRPRINHLRECSQQALTAQPSKRGSNPESGPLEVLREFDRLKQKNVSRADEAAISVAQSGDDGSEKHWYLFPRPL